MKKTIILIIQSILILIAIRYLGNIDNKGLIDIIMLLLIFNVIKNTKELSDKRSSIITLVFSILFSILIIVSKEIYLYHDLNNLFLQWYKYIIKFAGLILLFKNVFNNLTLLFNKINIYDKNNKIKKEYIILSIALLVIVYLVCYASFYPGIFSYDMSYQDSMAKGLTALTNHHPIIHTLIWKLFVKIEYFSNIKYISIIGYSIFQLSFVIFTYMYLLKWEYKNKCNKKVLIGTYLYFLINPILHVFSFNPTKDVFFGCFLLLFIISIIDLYNNHSKNNIIKFILFGVLACLFRNNYIYALVIFMPLSYIFLKKKNISICLIIIIVLSYISGIILLHASNAYKCNTAEKLSIPLIQIHYVYKNTDVFTKKDKEMLKQYIPKIDIEFNSRISDNVKSKFNSTLYSKNRIDFWKLYLKGLVKKPYEYIVSALDLNSPYLYYDSEFIDPINKKGYIQDALYDEEYHNKLPNILIGINDIYISIDNATNNFIKLPIIKFFFTISFNFYLLLILLYFNIIKKNKIGLTITSLLLIFIFTHLLGPISNMRYMYPLYLNIPLILISSLINNKNIAKK